MCYSEEDMKRFGEEAGEKAGREALEKRDAEGAADKAKAAFMTGFSSSFEAQTGMKPTEGKLEEAYDAWANSPRPRPHVTEERDALRNREHGYPDEHRPQGEGSGYQPV